MNRDSFSAQLILKKLLSQGALLRQGENRCPSQRYILLRNLLAQIWLQKNQISANFLPEISPSWHSLQNQLEQLLGDYPSAPEGTPHAFTPEIISQLSECYTSQQNTGGVFYTPFNLARTLAQETLLAWLKSHHFLPDTAHTPDVSGLNANDRLRLNWALSKLTVCDPACGAGGLLIPFWLELATLRHTLLPQADYAQLLYDIAAHNLYGADINPQAVDDLRLRLSLTLATYGKEPPNTLHFCIADALAGDVPSVWGKHFPEVFCKGGFDIYLANPPYIGQKNHKEIFATLRKNPHWQKWLTPKSDLLYLFFHLAFDLLAPDGVAGLLTTTYFAQATSAKSLRTRLQQEADLLRLLDFGDEKLFDRAQGQHNLITLFTPQKKPNTHCLCGVSRIPRAQKDLFFGAHVFLDTQEISPTLQSALTKMDAISTRLKDCVHISNGLMTGYDQAFILNAKEKNNFPFNADELKKLKPFFKNSDISPYIATQTPRFYLIDLFYPNDRNIDLTRYPHFVAHLAKFKDKLLTRKQNNNGIQHALKEGKYWFGSVRRKMNFDTEKLVIPHRARRNLVAYTPEAWYASSDVYFISAPRGNISLWYLLALLNSRPYYLWLFYKGKRKGNLLELYAQPLGELPVPSAPPLTQSKLEHLAQYIYARKRENTTADTSAEQTQIDTLLYTLFGFNDCETDSIRTFSPR